MRVIILKRMLHACLETLNPVEAVENRWILLCACILREHLFRASRVDTFDKAPFASHRKLCYDTSLDNTTVALLLPTCFDQHERPARVTLGAAADRSAHLSAGFHGNIVQYRLLRTTLGAAPLDLLVQACFEQTLKGWPDV